MVGGGWKKKIVEKKKKKKKKLKIIYIIYILEYKEKKKNIIDKIHMLGEYSYGGTPSYIPNLEVKPIYADGTWLEAAWESMDLPSNLLP